MLLDQILARMRWLDTQTHHWGKQQPKPGKTYDVDYENPRFKLTKQDTMTVLEGLQTDEALVLTKIVMETPSLREEFLPGYQILYGIRFPGAEGETESLLTISIRQLPDRYKEAFEEFRKSKENRRRADWFGVRRLSQYE